MKSILITGCSTGIGYETALLLKEHGYNVFATARNEEDVSRLNELGLNSYLIDVTKYKTIHNTLEKILEITGGTLDVVFNNAGYGQPGAVEDIKTKVLKEQFETNVFGLHEVTQAVLPIMRKQGHGRIIQHSSVLGLISLKYRGAYNASKYAIEGLSDTLRLELEGSNIFVSLLNTGPVKSNFRKNGLDMFRKNIDIKNSFFKKEYESELSQRLESNKDDTPFTLEATAVSNIVLEIIEANRPRPRYYITKATYILGFAKRILSTSWLDKILVKL
jgi:short-subunit dehydrogenase